MTAAKQKERLDVLLCDAGHFDSRAKAQRAIMAGAVTVNGQVADKPGSKTPLDAVIEVTRRERYVGRGALKLEAALKEFHISPEGMVCLDVGASTGGFTDCMLQHGAAKVHAVDVGHGQLDWKIRSDPRVEVLERFNARHMTPDDFDTTFDLCVIDVSFISLELILGPVFSVLRPGAWTVALIKPQFEVRKGQVGKGGIVRDPALHEQVITKIQAFVAAHPSQRWVALMDSPITGTDGNKEFLVCLQNVSE